MDHPIPLLVLAALVAIGCAITIFGQAGIAGRSLRARQDRYARRMVEPRRPGPGRPR